MCVAIATNSQPVDDIFFSYHRRFRVSEPKHSEMNGKILSRFELCQLHLWTCISFFPFKFAI